MTGGDPTGSPRGGVPAGAATSGPRPGDDDLHVPSGQLRDEVDTAAESVDVGMQYGKVQVPPAFELGQIRLGDPHPPGQRELGQAGAAAQRGEFDGTVDGTRLAAASVEEGPPQR